MVGKQGQVAFVFLMLGIVIIIFALSLAKPMKELNDEAMNSSYSDNGIEHTGLDCSNVSISSYQQAQCIITDMANPYIIVGFLFIGVMVVGAKLLGAV